MKNTKSVFAVVVFIALAGLLVYEHHQNNFLRTAFKRSSAETEQPQTLPQQTSPVADATENARAESEHAELMRLRAAVATLHEARLELTKRATVSGLSARSTRVHLLAAACLTAMPANGC